MHKQTSDRVGRGARVLQGALAVGLLALSAGCTSWVSRGLTDEGTASEVVFPVVDDTITLPEGTRPTLESLRAVQAGVTKDQLYALLGRPHFREGMFGVREWDYLFHLRTAQGERSCQFKVIFDSAYRGRSFHWLPSDCASVLDAAPAR